MWTCLFVVPGEIKRINGLKEALCIKLRKGFTNFKKEYWVNFEAKVYAKGRELRAGSSEGLPWSKSLLLDRPSKHTKKGMKH